MSQNSAAKGEPRAAFAESIPTGMETLAGTEGVRATADALIELTETAEHSIDLMAMYWALRPNPARDDEARFDKETLRERFRADRGEALYDALDRAATRGVAIRILQSPGFDSADDESGELHDAAPEQIQIRAIKMPDWYGSGIMHQKIWVFDGRSLYLGSANMDWKSLTQVKELGIVVEDAPNLAVEVARYFDTWWKLAGLKPIQGDTATIFDPVSIVERQVPAWSPLVPPDRAIPNPLDDQELRTWYGWDAPQPVTLGGEPGHLVLSGAPHEVCVGRRTFDGDLLVKTILDAESSVCISVMDFAPVSLYRGMWSSGRHEYLVGDHEATPVWWPALVDALLHVVSTKAVSARLLISRWAHTSEFIGPYLEALTSMANAASANQKMQAGTLEIKRFEVPGWDRTQGKDTEQVGFPGHTRVNHTKYIVTDRRFNVGTSNMTWDYFHGTAGASLNGNHPALRSKLQEIFDRDWNSAYALPNSL